MSLRHLERSYAQGGARSDVLRRMTLDIQAGEFVSIMGPRMEGKEIMQLFRTLNETGTTIVQGTHSERNAFYGSWLVHLRDGGSSTTRGRHGS